MVKKVPEETLTELLDIVKRHSNGITVRPPTSKKRRPASFPDEHYSIDFNNWLRRVSCAALASGDYTQIIRLSDEGQDVRAYVRQPVANRKPVGYNRDFLAEYQPNCTSYLTSTDREKFAGKDKPTAGVQPAGTYAKHIFNRFLIDLAWNSSRLEGNTYSLVDTKRLIEFGDVAEGRDQIEAVIRPNGV